MNLSILVLMGIFFGATWLVRLSIAGRFSHKSCQRVESSSCETIQI